MKRKLVLAILLILIFALSAMVAYGSTPADHLRVNGIDISPFNGEIDWDKAKADGVEFAFIRIGGQYYGEKGGHYFDNSLKANYDGAKNSGIMVGGYFFSQAITVEEAIKEAEESHNYIIENGINPSDFELPFFIDRELIADDDGPGRLKAANLSVEQELEIELAFCNRLRELGYESGLYSYLNFLNNNTDSTVLSDLGYPIWVAQYYDECEYEHIYNLWQFTESGTVDGIGVPTDCDYWYINKSLKSDTNSNFTLDRCTIELTPVVDSDISAFTIKDGDVTLVENTDYQVIGRIESEGYTIIRGLGQYKGYRAIPYSIEMEPFLPAPTGLKLSTDDSTNDVTLTWNAVEGAAGYKVYRSTSPNGTYTRYSTRPATSRSYTDTNTKSGLTYYYRVTAIGETKESDWAQGTITCNLAKPNLTLSNVSSTGKIKLSWNKVDRATGYEIYRSSGNDNNYKKYSTRKAADTSYTDTKAVAGITYYYKIRAIYSTNTAANSAYDYESLTCDLQRPNLKLSNVSSTGKIKLSWNTIEGATGYEIYRSAGNDDNYKKYSTRKATATSYTDTGAKAGIKYYYKIRAIYAGKSSANSVYDYENLTCDLAKPKITVSATKSKGKLYVKWDAVERADYYIVYRATSKNGTYKKYATTTKTAYTNTSVTKGKTYFYKVRAIKKGVSDANSAYSNIGYAKVK